MSFMKEMTRKNGYLSVVLAAFVFMAMMILFFVIAGISSQARTITIRTPKQLKNINWKFKGYGPGNKYVIGNDFTLGDGDKATCRLTKGKFVIDFNGHTVQNANHKLGVFSISGANVVLQDSKVKKNKPSVRSYGAGAIDMTGGKLLIKSGNYTGLSDGTNNPAGLHVGGGKCTVKGGYIYGEAVGSDCAGGSLKINGGTFQTAYMFALADFGGGKIKIKKGKFVAGTTTYGYRFPIGAFSQGKAYNFKKWLAKGSKFNKSFQTGYWNMQSQVMDTPSTFTTHAVAFNVPVLKVVKK